MLQFDLSKQAKNTNVHKWADPLIVELQKKLTDKAITWGISWDTENVGITVYLVTILQATTKIVSIFCSLEENLYSSPFIRLTLSWKPNNDDGFGKVIISIPNKNSDMPVEKFLLEKYLVAIKKHLQLQN